MTDLEKARARLLHTVTLILRAGFVLAVLTFALMILGALTAQR